MAGTDIGEQFDLKATAPNVRYESRNSSLSYNERKSFHHVIEKLLERPEHVASHSVSGNEDVMLTVEERPLFQSLQNCLDLRDKYMVMSRQRFSDNPRDHDDVFHGIDEDLVDVMGVRPDANFRGRKKPPATYKPWSIYPPPAPPRWHWKDNNKRFEVNSMVGWDIEPDFEFEKCAIPGDDSRTFELDNFGVFQVYSDVTDNDRRPVFEVPTAKEYYMDLDLVLDAISDGPTKSFALRRLKYLQNSFETYSLLNEHNEVVEMKKVSHRDFYNVRKVDTHIHHTSSMSQEHLLRFIKTKLKHSPNDEVIYRNGKVLTLTQVFESLGLSPYDLTIDTLDMHSHQDTFHRFDKFNSKYNPIGETRLKEIFLKSDNYIKGRYLAELSKELITEMEKGKYQNSEWRISIHGHHMDEWDKLAKWVINHKLFSHNIRWLIQVPRLYHIYKQKDVVDNFEDIVRKIFQPLFEVTKDPRTHPELHVFLQRVIGFDSVDDESDTEIRFHEEFPVPKHWTFEQSPPYSYQIYYLYANIASLNRWRQARGFNTFVLRPHCGEAGDPSHLATAFLTSHSIAHGITLRKVPALQYLFYLKQVGIAMSPLSNNSLFLTYERNPFPDFFKAGLNVSLSSDDPLIFHFTKEPLLEEYSVATHIYKLTQSSLAELARNSVIQSGFEMQVKRHWLGDEWYLPGPAGNDINRTNVPNIRLAFRHRMLLNELNIIQAGQSVNTLASAAPVSRISNFISSMTGKVMAKN